MGPGAIKHLDIRHLALQSWIKSGKLKIVKENTKTQLGDIFTKAVDKQTLWRLCPGLGLRLPTSIELSPQKAARCEALLAACMLASQAYQTRGNREVVLYSQPLDRPGQIDMVEYFFGALCIIAGFIVFYGQKVWQCRRRVSMTCAATQTDSPTTEIIVTPFGDCYHLKDSCFGLRKAGSLNKRRPCAICASSG